MFDKIVTVGAVAVITFFGALAYDNIADYQGNQTPAQGTILGDSSPDPQIGTAIEASRIVVGPRGVVHGSGLPRCGVEDGGPVLPCQRLNEGPLSYWVGKHHVVHYVWAHNPAHHDGWRWVSRRLSHRLANGDVLPTWAATRPHYWWRCVVKVGPTTKVRCADGSLTTS
jgi:hypothetical protein